MSSRFQFVDDHRGAFGVKRLCRMLKLSRSGFYRWPAGADAELAERIAGIHAEPDGTYGAPRVTAELRDDGVRVNHKRVARVIRAGASSASTRARRFAPPSRNVSDPGAGPVATRLHRRAAEHQVRGRHNLSPGRGRPIPLSGNGVGPVLKTPGGLVDRRPHAHRARHRHAESRGSHPGRRRPARGRFPQRQRAADRVEGVRPGLR
ncbi:transposase [Streptomyces sp. LBUM 1476]|nr:transposase [Streptomyces sp. LBUM 1476]